MKRIEQKKLTAKHGRGALAGLAALAVIGVVVLILNFRSPPQMGPDKDVFKEVDALFTAVTARDEQQLGKCAARLQDLTNKDKLPAQAAAYLNGVIAMTRAGSWQPAAERLYAFMKSQRREP